MGLLIGGLPQWSRQTFLTPTMLQSRRAACYDYLEHCGRNCHRLVNSRLVLSVVSEARVSKLHTRARCVCALSIERLEGRRWRLRQMRANGYGNSIFSPICKLLVLRYLENEYVREPQFDTLCWGMTRGA